MTFTLDPRTGSGDLAEALRCHIPVQVRHLEFGDVEIVGRGPEERPVLVGYEIKKIGDFLQCVKDDRFVGHQLPGLRKSYEMSYLVLEGVWTCDQNGQLLVYNGGGKAVPPPWGEGWNYLTLRKRLTTLEVRTGLRIAYTGDRRSTVAFLVAEYQWWQEKYESHESHLALRTKDLQAENSLVEYEADWQATKKMKVVADILRGVGIHKALAASRHFRSILEMVNAPIEEWKKIAGFGPKLAKQFVDEVRREG